MSFSDIKKIKKMLDILERIGIVLSVLCLVAMAVLMNTEVFLRYVLGFSTQISDEYAGYLFIAATMLCFYPALRRNRFLQIQALVELLPFKVRAVLEILSTVCGAFICVVLGWQASKLSLSSLRLDSVSLQISQTPLWIPQIVVPIGFALLFVGFVEKGIKHSYRLWNGLQPVEPDEVDHVVD